MKKLICFVLCSLLIFGCFVPAASAEYENEKTYFDDGSYLEISETGYEETEEDAAPIPSLISRIIKWLKGIIDKLKGNKFVTKSKYATYYSSEGEILWSVHLKAEFTYNGKKAVCDKSEINAMIYDLDWRLLESSHSEKDNTAQGSFVMKQYKLGVPLKEIEKTLTLTCDKNGNVK